MTTNSINKEKIIFGHPAGLYILFFVEMWERFSYYGMRAILTLFLAAPVIMGDPQSGYGWSNAETLSFYGSWLTNDDGYLSEGIIALAKAMRDFGRVSVFAPEVDKSGSSNSLTLNRPLIVKKAKSGFFYINGTPTDCVHLAATKILNDPPDFVVSGINCGRNVAQDVHYSGTVAAAMEGFMLKIPSIAFSLDSGNFQNLATAVEVSKMLISKLISNPFSNLYLLNVNIPNVELKDFKGLSLCKPGQRVGAQVVSGVDGGDSAAVAFQAFQKAVIFSPHNLIQNSQIDL